MKIVAALVLLVVSMPVFSKDLTREGTKDVCATAASLFASGKFDEAYGGLSSYWPLPKEEIQNLGYQTKSQMAMVAERFGAAIAAEYIGATIAGDSLVKHVFLIKLEKHALRFSCIFYMPRDKWFVNAIFWDDGLKDLLEKMR